MIQCRADGDGTQAGGDGNSRLRPHPPSRDCGADVLPVEAAVCGTGIGTGGEFKQLQDERTKLKRLVADLSLDNVMLQDVLAKKF